MASITRTSTLDPSASVRLLQSSQSEQRERTLVMSFTEDFWWEYARSLEFPQKPCGYRCSWSLPVDFQSTSTPLRR